MKTLITLTLTAAEGGDSGVKIPADGILLDTDGNEGVWLGPGQSVLASIGVFDTSGPFS